MKKQSHVSSHRRKDFAARMHTSTQAHALGTIKWLAIPFICCAVFLFAGVVNAAQTSNPSPQWAQKQQVLQQQLNAGRAHAQPKSGSHLKSPAIQAAPVRQAGISNVGQGPFPPSVFTMRNSWQGPVGNDWVFAYAGAKTRADGTPGQGSIVLYTQTVNAYGGLDFHPLGTFAAPGTATALTIVAVDGALVKVHSDTGQNFTFNLQTHQFQ